MADGQNLNGFDEIWTNFKIYLKDLWRYFNRYFQEFLYDLIPVPTEKN
jgi:hypothetical protein